MLANIKDFNDRDLSREFLETTQLDSVTVIGTYKFTRGTQVHRVSTFLVVVPWKHWMELVISVLEVIQKKKKREKEKWEYEGLLEVQALHGVFNVVHVAINSNEAVNM